MSHPSTLLLHRLRLGELEGADRVAIDAHLALCERCQRRAAAQHDQRLAFVVEPVPAAIERLATPANGPIARWISGAAPLLAIAAAALFVVLSVPFSTPGERTKGTLPEMELWIGTSDGPRPARTDDVLSRGATVQVLYDANGAAFAVLAGRDGAGRIEVYGVLPSNDALAPAPFALTLDATPGPIEFFVVTSDSAITVEDVEGALRGERRDLRVSSVVAHKE